MKLSLLQSGDEDDSENLAQVLKDLRDSEAKLVSMLSGESGEETKKVIGFSCVRFFHFVLSITAFAVKLCQLVCF